MRRLLFILLCAVSWTAQADAPQFLGLWTVNAELSADVQPENAGARWWEGLGSFSSNASIGGIPIPVGSSTPAASGDTPSNPDMLRCQILKVEQRGEDELFLTYVNVDDEKIRRGSWRGTHSKWSSKKLSSNYESTSRKVTRSLEMLPELEDPEAELRVSRIGSRSGRALRLPRGQAAGRVPAQ